MTKATATKEKCKGCGREIEICAFCQEPDCAAAICFGCQSQELKQMVRHPHKHGG